MGLYHYRSGAVPTALNIPRHRLSEILIPDAAQRIELDITEAEELGVAVPAARPVEFRDVAVLGLELVEALDVVDEDADAVSLRGQVGEGERDAVGGWDDRGCDVRLDAAELAAVEEVAWGLENAVEAPAGDTVDEQADEQALVEEAGPSLHRRAGKEEEAEDVVMNAEVHVGDGDKGEDAAHEQAVEGEHARHATLVAERERLCQNDSDEDADDDEERGDGARLLLDVVRREPRDGDLVKGVRVEGADPAGPQPQDRFVPVGLEVGERVPHAEVVHGEADEGAGEEPAEGDRDHFIVIWGVGRVGGQGDLEVDDKVDGRVEGGGGGDEEGEHGGYDQREGEERPAEVGAARRGGVLRVEGEREREVRGEVGARDAVLVDSGEATMLAGALKDPASTARVAHDASVHRRRTDGRIPPVNTVVSGIATFRGTPDDETLVVDLLRADKIGFQHHRLGTTGRTPECEPTLFKGAASVAVQTAVCAIGPESRLAGELDGASVPGNLLSGYRLVQN